MENTFLFIIAGSSLFIVLALGDIVVSLQHLVSKTDKIEIVERTPVYYNEEQINGECALVSPPCFEDIGYHNLIRLRY